MHTYGTPDKAGKSPTTVHVLKDHYPPVSLSLLNSHAKDEVFDELMVQSLLPLPYYPTHKLKMKPPAAQMSIFSKLNLPTCISISITTKLAC